jgi:hypothetical protein
LLLIFEIPGLIPATFNSKKADNADVTVSIKDAAGDFGKVTMKRGDVFELVADDDDISTKKSWTVEGSYFEVLKGEVRIYLKESQ